MRVLSRCQQCAWLELQLHCSMAAECRWQGRTPLGSAKLTTTDSTRPAMLRGDLNEYLILSSARSLGKGGRRCAVSAWKCLDRQQQPSASRPTHPRPCCAPAGASSNTGLPLLMMARKPATDAPASSRAGRQPSMSVRRPGADSPAIVAYTRSCRLLSGARALLHHASRARDGSSRGRLGRFGATAARYQAAMPSAGECRKLGLVPRNSAASRWATNPRVTAAKCEARCWCRPLV